MQITKKENSVLAELSQAELSAIRLVSKMASESASELSSIDPGENLGIYSASKNLGYCSRFLTMISEDVGSLYSPHEYHKFGNEFFELFMQEALEEPSPLE